MIRTETYLGYVDISSQYFASLVGQTAASCYGVVGMSSCGSIQQLKSMLAAPNVPGQGVLVRREGKNLVIDLHIIVIYGVKISAIVKSIVHNVKYKVEESTGLAVSRVNVYVDGMKAQ